MKDAPTRSVRSHTTAPAEATAAAEAPESVLLPHIAHPKAPRSTVQMVKSMPLGFHMIPALAISRERLEACMTDKQTHLRRKEEERRSRGAEE